MASEQDFELLAGVGLGTAMGRLLREYWVPACGSAELATDGPPMRLMLLGEKLVAFRDSAGRVGIMDHRCPHRGASLFFGRNEEGGLRCVYHGWKYDVTGQCLEMPNVPPQHVFADQVKARAYKTAERNGIVYCYMGTRKEAPPLPVMEALLLPEAEVRITWAQRECHWLQALEGDIDTSHVAFLHEGKVKPEEYPANAIQRWIISNRSPEIHVTDTEWGTMYAGHWPAGPANAYYRLAHFVFPFWTLIPNGPFKGQVVSRAWVPMDDTHTMFLAVAWKAGSTPIVTRNQNLPGADAAAPARFDYLPNTTDWHGRWRLAANATNDYRLDREAQRERSYTGIDGVHLQDQAITESMGGVVDRSFENLAVSDLMVTRTRRRLIGAARALAETGAVPPILDDPETCLGAHSGNFVAPARLPWREAYAAELRNSANPTGALRFPAVAAE
ncbi:MAG TPA: Rieske 2Fe-2S domain-containing protein [Stellaceae bacterium]|nr:Rieske 2Fe-2S domain-containing protein [Stellaceae bacterium]